MNENPYNANRIVNDKASREKNRSGKSITNHLLRFVFAVSAFVYFPAVIAPRLKDLFEEFEIGLPHLLRLVFAFGDFVSSYVFLVVPFSIGILCGIEFCLFRMKKGRGRTVFGMLYWLLLVAIVLTVAFSFFVSFWAITTGLASKR